ncbi:helix-turn-helix domain-containing protein [Psychrobacillus psychrodurans]|uniref:helix-turn-helix domain-containing protein n=1 Tax=Psychrobacillus psychrodurans TaxID=126157 RepID=UPI001F4E66F1|nr:helix-turn-helix domain-containing protein [Psychrobacillus psychrodurans]MCK1998312.1 helix-turn-helix domain-containing protein [Psychrobacillus psychrodurans]
MIKRSQQKDTQPKRNTVNKVTPGADGRTFIPFPSNALHYIHLDKITADKLFLYTLLIDYLNVDVGAAWPSNERLSVDYGRSAKTTGLHIRDLERAGLVAIPSKGRYVPLEPLSAAEFYAKFPEAWSNYTEALAKAEQRQEDDRQRLREYRERKEYTRK